MVDITLLGTASLLPLPDRAETAVTLRCAGRTILFDCGEGTQCAARRAGVSLMKTDLIALTHYHGDHTFGLPGLLQTMSVQGRTEPLFITGPQGLSQALAPILHLAGERTFPVLQVALPPEGLDLWGMVPAWPVEARLIPVPTSHRVPSQGYCFILDRAGAFQPDRARKLGIPLPLWGSLQHGNRVKFMGTTFSPKDVLGPPRRGIRFVFSGDTTPCDTLTAASRDADLLICEGTYGENSQEDLAEEYGHMTFAQAARTAAEAGARRLWLCHYSQRIRDPQEFLPNATAIFPQAVCGEDGMSISLNFEDEDS